MSSVENGELMVDSTVPLFTEADMFRFAGFLAERWKVDDSGILDVKDAILDVLDRKEERGA